MTAMLFAPVIIAVLYLAPSGSAQQRAAEAEQEQLLRNTGAPMRLEFQCLEEDINLVGLGCTADDPCSVFLELAAVEPVGAKIFVAGNIHTSSTTLYSVLLASQDGGKTWREPFRRIRSAVLDRMQFFDLETGWIGGQLVHALPHDPFLLLTTDGGSIWRHRPISEESRVGAIEQFQFESRTDGTLWLDRSQSGETEALYERYETMTGGESWMLRELSSRPILKKSEAAGRPSAGWRLRPDAATSSYRIENRDGEQWQVIASFLIPIGECKPQERVLPEPPDVPEAPAEETAPQPELDQPPRKAPTLKRKFQ